MDICFPLSEVCPVALVVSSRLDETHPPPVASLVDSFADAFSGRHGPFVAQRRWRAGLLQLDHGSAPELS